MTVDRRATSNNPRQARLHLYGPASLTIGGETPRLRRKGLALLYYLAVEGPTRRERAADLLWNRSGVSQNLRVELHRLKAALQEVGLKPFEGTGDTLRLSPNIRLDNTPRAGTMMEGLDDVSAAFQDWLDRQRLASPKAVGGHLRNELIDDLAETIAAPYVMVLVGNPGSGRRDLASELARRLELPFIDTNVSTVTGPAVRYVVSEDAEPHLARQVANDSQSVWVLQRSPFGEDPDLLLQLRSVIAPERMRFVRLDPLRWWDVQAALPEGTSFAEGARLFLASGGNPRYLNEVLKLRERVGAGGDLPVPLTMRAKFALETRRLSADARRALESLCIYRGPLSSEILNAMCSEAVLAELEYTGWLRFSGNTWRLGDDLARRMIADAVPEGARRRLHAALASALQREGSERAAAAHLKASMSGVLSPNLVMSEDQGPAPTTMTVKVGNEVLLDEPSVSNGSVRVAGDKVLFSRSGEPCVSSVSWALDEGPLLLRVRGRASVSDECSWDQTGRSTTVALTFPGARATEVHVCQTAEAYHSPDQPIRLPVNGLFEYWLLAPAAPELRIESSSHSAVVELRVNAFTPGVADPMATAGHGFVEAILLETRLAQSDDTDVPVASTEREKRSIQIARMAD